ncbi:hypothetical protein BKA64DRAFT_722364 [Cadophora sp. MPI-SDFR-AT-0126]|nr:hypothetical protein BKA64DRAFT_722364 [Leotiomycetes sp. MPI-SDFR-AT-0126]
MAHYTGTLKPLSSLTSGELRKELDSFHVVHTDKELKPDLQAKWALHTLGFVNDNGKTSAALLEKVVNWFKIPVPDLHNIVDDAGLESLAASRAVLRACSSPNKGKAAQDTSSPASNTSLKTQQKSQSKVARSNLPTPEVANSLITMIYADLMLHKDQLSSIFDFLPGCPVDSTKETIEHLEKVPWFERAEHLKTETNPLSTPSDKPAQKLLSWICATMGSDIFFFGNRGLKDSRIFHPRFNSSFYPLQTRRNLQAV